MMILDLFCGAGGASKGYHDAGFDVVGVDLKPQPHYPYEFIQADAVQFLKDMSRQELMSFDAIHASPPCQRYSRAAKLAPSQGGTVSSVDLVEPVRTLLTYIGLPYVLENVVGSPLRPDVVLCGSMFGLKVRRHRVFEVNGFNLDAPPACDHKAQGKPVGVYGSMGDTVQGTDSVTGRYVVGGSTARTLEEGQAAMGIDWMPWRPLKESIPPAYTEWIGAQLYDQILAESERDLVAHTLITEALAP